ncbi:MAG: HDOD domain-containing protein, partial [Desulfobulbia bacterium]
VLADEVRDLTGKLLLGKDITVQPEHFRVFNIWGVSEVNIRGNNGGKEEAKPNLDPEQIEKIKESTLQVFSHNDLNHPAIKEIFRLSVLFRNEYTFSNTNSNVQLVEDEPAKNIGEKNCVKKLAEADITLPELPSIVFELNEVIANPMSSADDIAQVVQKSPSLTAILLKIANSPLYGFPSKIDKISSAVILIGTREITGLALGLSVLTTFDKIPKGLLDMFSFLKHSLACGIISRMLASRKGISQTEQFFVSGLLHDLGRLIIYCNFPEDSRNILNCSRTTNNLLYEVEKDYFGCNHSHVAKHLIQQWKLPISLENNVFYHHNPSEAQQSVPATLVHLADIITNGLGIGTSGERLVPPLDTEAWESLGLSPSCFDSVIKPATHQFFAFESMLEN